MIGQLLCDRRHATASGKELTPRSQSPTLVRLQDVSRFLWNKLFQSFFQIIH